MPPAKTGIADSLVNIRPLKIRASTVQGVGGFTTLGSGQAAVDVVLANYKSTDLIMIGALQVGSFGAVSSNVGNIVLSSTQEGVGFTFASESGVARKYDTVIHWLRIQTK